MFSCVWVVRTKQSPSSALGSIPVIYTRIKPYMNFSSFVITFMTKAQFHSAGKADNLACQFCSKLNLAEYQLRMVHVAWKLVTLL